MPPVLGEPAIKFHNLFPPKQIHHASCKTPTALTLRKLDQEPLLDALCGSLLAALMAAEFEDRRGTVDATIRNDRCHTMGPFSARAENDEAKMRRSLKSVA